MSVRDLNEGNQKFSHVEDQQIIEREFGQKKESVNKNLQSYKIWSVRSNDWYNSERRIIFATRTKKERGKWLKFFTKAAQRNKAEELRRQTNKKDMDFNIIGKDLSPTKNMVEQDILDLRLSGVKLTGGWTNEPA